MSDWRDLPPAPDGNVYKKIKGRWFVGLHSGRRIFTDLALVVRKRLNKERIWY
jgi:hypothetical protein